MMKRLRAPLALTVALAVCGLSACTGDNAQQTAPVGGQPSAPATSMTPTPSATPSPTPTPTPAVDPRTAAVTKAVDRYYKVTEELYRKPNRAPWRKLQTVSQDEAFQMRQGILLDMFQAQRHSTGSKTWKVVKVGKIAKESGKLQVSATTCWDVTAVDIVDKRGKSVINKKKRPNRGSAALTLRLDDKVWYVVRDRNGKAKC